MRSINLVAKSRKERETPAFAATKELAIKPRERIKAGIYCNVEVLTKDQVKSVKTRGQNPFTRTISPQLPHCCEEAGNTTFESWSGERLFS